MKDFLHPGLSYCLHFYGRNMKIQVVKCPYDIFIGRYVKKKDFFSPRCAVATQKAARGRLTSEVRWRGKRSREERESLLCPSSSSFFLSRHQWYRVIGLDPTTTEERRRPKMKSEDGVGGARVVLQT